MIVRYASEETQLPSSSKEIVVNDLIEYCHQKYNPIIMAPLFGTRIEQETLIFFTAMAKIQTVVSGC